MVDHALDTPAGSGPAAARENSTIDSPSAMPPVSRRRRKSRPWLSGSILAIFVFVGAFGPMIYRRDPLKINLSASLRPPVFAGGDWGYALGTDQLGRDVLARLIHGARVSLLVAVAVVVLAGLVGLLVAVLAGYIGGRLDAILMRTTDASMAFPVLLLAITIVGIFGTSTRNVVIILAFAGWPQYARVLRSEVLRIKTNDFVTMTRTMGGNARWIVYRHILPNLLPTLLVLVSLQVGLAIIAEGSLSFLGIGVPPPAPSWGGMLSDGRAYLIQAWWLPAMPGIALSFTVLAANLLGDWLRVHNDPTTRR